MSQINEVARWLRAEIELTGKSRELGVPRIIDHDLAMLAFRRAAEEIERLVHENELMKSVDARFRNNRAPSIVVKS